jgi:hypothetical protein
MIARRAVGVAQIIEGSGRAGPQRGQRVLDQRGNAKESDMALKKG